MKVSLALPAADVDANATLSEDGNSTNWFFYRDFVEGIDRFQAYWSHRIIVFSSNLDQKLYLLYENDESGYAVEQPSAESSAEGNVTIVSVEDNTTRSPELRTEKERQTYAMSTWYDEFFKDETYLDATNTSYMRIRGGRELDRRGKSSFFHSITARIRLPKTANRLQIFIGDERGEEGSATEQVDSTDNQGVGVKYFLPTIFKHINASASIGFSRVTNPYTKAHAEYPFLYKSWLTRVIQQARYSYKYEFQEWTSLYFDRKISDREMVRLLLQKSTQTSVVGIDYLARISYLNTLKHGVGFNNYIAVKGRTKDLKDPYFDGSIPQEGVYNYVVGMVWKQSFFRDYLFYQLEPIVEFHEKYDYMINYRFRASLELYFGRL